MVHAWTQLQSELTRPFLQHMDQNISFVDSQFMKALQKDLHSIQSTITVDKTSIPHPLRSRDNLLMDHAVSLSFNTFRLQCINAVQLYHHVTFLSEIYNVDGTHICL